MIQGINVQLHTKIKWPTRQPHMRRNAAHEQGDTSSIRGNTLSMNQTRSRGSTGPPELLNRLKTSHAPHIWNGGPPNSVPVKFGAERPPLLVGRSAIGRFVSAPSSTCWLPIRCQGRFQEVQGWIHGRRGHGTPYIYERREELIHLCKSEYKLHSPRFHFTLRFLIFSVHTYCPT